jgi:hypothetical protein
MKLGRIRLWLALLWLAGELHAQAEGFRLESAGTRAGTSKIGADAQFYQLEAFVNWNMPSYCRWDCFCGCHLQWRLDLTAGWINGRGDDAIIGSLGPTFEIGRDDFPLLMECGSSPTILSREHFGNTDFGIPFQFTTHGSILWRLKNRLTLEARFQHMSNANIGPKNPGVNMYMLGVGWRF